MKEKRYKNMGKLLKAKRNEKGYTQNDVAKLIGCDRTTYTYYENGKIVPSVFTIYKMAGILRIHYKELFDVLYMDYLEGD